MARCQGPNSTIAQDLQILRFTSSSQTPLLSTILHDPSRPFIYYTKIKGKRHDPPPHCVPRSPPHIMAVSPPPPVPTRAVEKTTTNSISSHTLDYSQDGERRHTIRKMKSSFNLHDTFRRGEAGCGRGPAAQVRSSSTSYSSL